MHGKIIQLDDAELDQLVVNEFDRIEKVARTRPTLKETGTGEDAVRSERRAASENAGETGSILTVDEEKFVADTVEWLISRENRNAVMARIQEHLAERVPESLFSAGDEYISDDNLQCESNEMEADPETGADT